jgi:hypothetical protein
VLTTHCCSSAPRSLAGNRLTGSVPTSWASLTSMVQLDVRGSSGMCGSLPPALLRRVVNQGQRTQLAWNASSSMSDMQGQITLNGSTDGQCSWDAQGKCRATVAGRHTSALQTQVI